MKTVTDPGLKITVSNKKVSYDRRADVISPNDTDIADTRKNGYLVSGDDGKLLGILYKSDNKRTASFGDCEILFFKEHEKEYGTRRVVKMYGGRFPFDTLEKILSSKETHTLVIDARKRRPK